MTQLKRRQFIQSAGTALATLGFSQLEFQHHALRYAGVLAQTTQRKRALLVGISDYPSIRAVSGWARLPGAINDVEMQRELLVHRFGFSPNDVRLITDQNATRNNILLEFEDLIKWSKPGDVVVIHYSGHGSTVYDPDRIFADNLNGTLVPWDSDLPPRGGEVNDITSGTLFLLVAALKTENVTVVLDSCYSGGGVRGNLVIRSRPGQAELSLRGEAGEKLVANDAEREYQKQWLAKLDLSHNSWIAQRRQGLAKGAALLAARRDQEAADGTFAGGTHAGVFTYSLTRYLWQQTRNESMGTVLVAAKAKTEKFISTSDGKKRSQTPEFQEKSNSGYQQQPTFFLADFAPQQKQSAAAVVTKVEGKQVEVLLNGIEPDVLETVGKGSSFDLVNEQGRPIGSVEITERDQLRAQGIVTLKMPGTIAPGALLQERSRLIPHDWRLRIGLDPSLGKEGAIAQVELPKIQSRIEPRPLLQGEVHYILGQMTKPIYDQLSQRRVRDLPKIGSVGLFYPGLEPLPESFGQPDESVEQALRQRLQPKFKFLLAGRLLRLMLNPTSTRLNVKAAVRVAGSREFSAQAVAVRGSKTVPLVVGPSVKQVRVDEQIQIVVENKEPKDLHCAIVFLSVNGDVEAFPGQMIVPVGAVRTLPPKPATVTVKPPLGVLDVMVVFSTKSLEKVGSQLRMLSEADGDRRGGQAFSAVDMLLADLAESRSGGSQSQGRLLDPSQVAVLLISLNIIA